MEEKPTLKPWSKTTNKLIVSAFIIFSILFYWFQIRPSQIKSGCTEQAKEEARSSLRKKAGMDPFNSEYKKAVEQNMYLKKDNEDFYQDCLHSKGL